MIKLTRLRSDQRVRAIYFFAFVIVVSSLIQQRVKFLKPCKVNDSLIYSKNNIPS